MICNFVKNFWILVSFASSPPFCTISWWRHFVCKKQRKGTRFTIFPEGNRLRTGFFNWNAFLNIVSIHETIFITSFSSGEMFPSTVTFQRSDTLIFPYTIMVICKQNGVIGWYLTLVDNMKTKWDVKEIYIGFLIIRWCRSFAAIKIFASGHLQYSSDIVLEFLQFWLS